MPLAIAPTSRQQVKVASSWDGNAAADSEIVELDLELNEDELVVRVQAPFHDDPPPAGPPGSVDHLWEHEVVELMLLGDDDRYLEIELSPHGHYLVLQLHGARNVVARGMPLAYRVSRRGQRWQGEARIPLSWLPRGCRRLNAYAIHGRGEARRFLAWRPAGGPRPDFHRLEAFGALSAGLSPSCAGGEDSYAFTRGGR